MSWRARLASDLKAQPAESRSFYLVIIWAFTFAQAVQDDPSESVIYRIASAMWTVSLLALFMFLLWCVGDTLERRRSAKRASQQGAIRIVINHPSDIYRAMIQAGGRNQPGTFAMSRTGFTQLGIRPHPNPPPGVSAGTILGISTTIDDSVPDDVIEIRWS